MIFCKVRKVFRECNRDRKWGRGKTNMCITVVEKENQGNMIEQILKDMIHRNVLVIKSF